MSNKGFTLLELVIVIGILAVIAAVSSPLLRGIIKKIEVDSSSQSIVAFLKEARTNAMTGMSGRKWGVHFVNGVNDDYYEVFSTPTGYNDAEKTINSIAYLPQGIYFTDPVATADIIFGKIAGTTTATTTISLSSPDGITKTITVTPTGTIY
ncbi:TPA: hypothetical protein DEW47_04055 [Patescibacteria group bacterium]|nr:MAG: Pilus assembly protein [Parcubacteria group bacterium GW2011_GWF2_40_10]KKR47965.1 MAG: Pilus assembly protein [Parcubacteria group bacterium GW2011_GWA2_40_143]KKR60445.1 MAG: Pilus assembly protein [Parcubacteria group bacterium GW2011_GWC2_40_31]KKR74507.1 MAG: Pilus assembly protein [Parcubacteria group bacterium GW2011_GWB2_40_8]KKR77584.1 MAG: Pilus assembly protein [Parcubacteria group bacterium GW2011_GWE2_40_8]KKR82868.1 MAG: Pilus assembly protein [Parcubacteria group bacteri